MSTSTRARRASRAAPFALALAVAAVLPAGADPTAPASAPGQRGAALGLYSEDPNWSYVDMLDEMKAAGVSHVAIVWPWYMKTDHDPEIYKHPRYTVPERTVTRTIADARARGMEIMLFPILRMEDQSTGGWRGTLHPADPDRFWSNYQRLMLRLATMAERLAIPLLAVGSEMASLEAEDARWRSLIAAVRGVYRGKLVYSANWDHYFAVPFFDALDYAGVTGYFELVPRGAEPTVEELVHGWREHYVRLMRFEHKVKRPLILTEVGYLSQKGTASWPWKEAADEPIDLEIQRRCYEAFRRVWAFEPRLAGSYFWNWFGWGGPTSKEYTPRNKPAMREVAAWYVGSASTR
ncbi:MAG: hypothetical protein PHU25_20760 [Deltaproteobacteria bacterium]|nr:hypothetical protein [Deltaproteobacteria bacterium]